MTNSGPCVVIDRTHLGRRASGIERITRELFSDEGLSPLAVAGTRSSGGRLAMMLRQTLQNPIEALRRPGTIWIFSGYPPSPLFRWFAHRSILYVHDLFLVDRTQDLNRAARFYMAPSFRAALRSFRFFFANSSTTADRLRPYVDPRSTVQLYRPPARDVLALDVLALDVPALDAVRDPPDAAGSRQGSQPKPLAVGMIGTVEPRKNYLAAVAICRELGKQIGRAVELHIVGRPGWGGEAEALAKDPLVRLHGFVDDAALATLVRGWDLFLSTSHDEGLGLPLLEVQHAGLPIVAPDSPVFREVLDASGIFIATNDPPAAAAVIAAELGRPDRRQRFEALGRANIARWNALAAADHSEVVAMLSERIAALSGGRP